MAFPITVFIAASFALMLVIYLLSNDDNNLW